MGQEQGQKFCRISTKQKESSETSKSSVLVSFVVPKPALPENDPSATRTGNTKYKSEKKKQERSAEESRKRRRFWHKTVWYDPLVLPRPMISNWGGSRDLVAHRVVLVERLVHAGLEDVALGLRRVVGEELARQRLAGGLDEGLARGAVDAMLLAPLR